MSDQPAQTPAEQVPATPPQQAPAAPATTPPAENWKARYDGAMVKLQELTLKIRELEGQQTTWASEKEQLNASLALKDTEKSVAVGERDKQLQDALQKISALEGENKILKSLELKVKVAKDLQRPELLQIVDRIPSLDDEETLKTVMQDFAGFVDGQVKAREEQLLAGLTPGLGTGSQNTPPAPATPQAWEEHINSLPLGSTERAKAMDQYGDYLERQHKPS